MGTRIRISVDAGSNAASHAWAERALRIVEESERLMTTWDNSSPMSVLNRAPVGFGVEVPASLAEWLGEAFRWRIETRGAFDPTVGALVDAWDLRGEGRRPDSDELVAALRRSGGSAATLVDGVLTRTVNGAWIDTGGFGKGAALRSVARLVEKDTTVASIVIDLGGQIWAGGHLPVPVAIAHPWDREVPVAQIRLRGVSVATSGQSEHFVEADSERFGHILDPRSGVPVPPWGSVTVIHDDPLVADILATALFVMGPEDGFEWAVARPGLAVLFLQDRPEGLRPRWTPPFEPWFEGRPTFDRRSSTSNRTSSR